MNTYILNGAAVFSVLGVWFIKLGRRNAIASAYLIAAGVSAIVVTMQVCGKNLQRYSGYLRVRIADQLHQVSFVK